MIQKKKCPVIKLASAKFIVGALHLTGLVHKQCAVSLIFLW